MQLMVMNFRLRIGVDDELFWKPTNHGYMFSSFTTILDQSIATLDFQMNLFMDCWNSVSPHSVQFFN